MKALLLLSAAGIAALGYSEGISGGQPDETGTISGKVVWEGDRPEPKPALKIGAEETEGCTMHDGATAVDDSDHSLLISDDGGVANVVMMIEATEPTVPEEPIVIDQQGCRFTQRVAVVPVGGTIRFANSDETNHNIHTYAKKNRAQNVNVAGGSNLDQVLDKAETIEVKCDVHTWMKTNVVVTEASHWSVSAEDGSYSISGLPPGEYKIEWWHEELGKGKSEAITVTAGETTSYEHKVGASKKGGGGRRRR